jgi:fructokinase
VTLFGAVEIGGTKALVAVGTTHQDMSDPLRFATSGPDETLAEITRFLAGHDVDTVGVVSFGPLELDPRSARFGAILFTPKPGWTGTRVYERLASSLGVPVALDTDVNGAAIGEGRWGAAAGMTDYAYVTVGTGIGAGVVVDGKIIGGGRHPEMGHVVVSRRPGDSHQGLCPYHGDCLEGMASGPALEARFGRPNTWAGNDLVLDLLTHYLAQGVLNLVYTLAPDRIIVGGGVSALPGLHDRLRTRLGPLIAGYPQTPDLDLLISEPGLGDRSGLAGALVLAAGLNA